MKTFIALAALLVAIGCAPAPETPPTETVARCQVVSAPGNDPCANAGASCTPMRFDDGEVLCECLRHCGI